MTDWLNKLLNAARKRDAAQWALADALVKEASTREQQIEVAEALDIDIARVRKIRKTAILYPPEKRRSDAGYSLHELAAGDAQILAMLVILVKQGMKKGQLREHAKIARRLQYEISPRRSLGLDRHHRAHSDSRRRHRARRRTDLQTGWLRYCRNR